MSKPDARPFVLNQDGKLCLENADGTLSLIPKGAGVRICPGCLTTLDSSETNRMCVECRSAVGTVAELQNAFRLARIQKSMLPHRFIGHGRPNVERLDGWPEIAHFGGKLFGQTLGDEDLLRRVERWYIAEHGGSHESFPRMKRTKLADLLRAATDPPTAEAGTPERQKKPKGTARTDDMTDAIRRAYLGFKDAEHHAEDPLTDRDAYDWLDDEGPTEYDPLPTFTTWSRSLRKARQLLGEQKHKPRAGRTGRSVVRRDELETPESDES